MKNYDDRKHNVIMRLCKREKVMLCNERWLNDKKKHRKYWWKEVLFMF